MGLLLSLLPVAWFATKIFAHADRPTLVVKSSRDAKDRQRVSLREFIEVKCPSILKDFKPAWWLYNGHLQTGYCVVGDFSKSDKVEYERTSLKTLDGGTIGLDMTGDEDSMKDDTPIVIVMHGLTGGSHEAYVRAILAPTCAPREKGGLGYRGIVVNFRGCAGVPLTSPQLYSAGHTEDLRVAVYYISKKYPKAPLLGVGFSLGAGVITRYLAEEGVHSRLVAGCVLACPWDLYQNSLALDGRLVNRLVYSKALGSNLQALCRKHASSIRKFAGHPVAEALPVALELKSPRLVDFDSAFTRIGGGSMPPFPFATAYDYYDWASCHKVLGGIRVPFLAINAEDDPIVQVLPVGGAENECVAFAVTSKGGHLGWFEDGGKLGEIKRWTTQPVLEWLKAVGEELVSEPRQGKPLHEVDGYLKEEGRDDIGCMEIAGHEHVVGVEGEEGLIRGL